MASIFEDLAQEAQRASEPFPLMPVGMAVDMGTAADGTPLLDPRIFDTPEFFRNPYPYYRILRDHYPVYHDKLCLLYTSPSPRDRTRSRMPSSA